MNDEHVLIATLVVTNFGPGEHRKCSAAATVHPTVLHVHLNKRHVSNLAPFPKEYKRYTSQHTRITFVELVQTKISWLTTR